MTSRRLRDSNSSAKRLSSTSRITRAARVTQPSSTDATAASRASVGSACFERYARSRRWISACMHSADTGSLQSLLGHVRIASFGSSCSTNASSGPTIFTCTHASHDMSSFVRSTTIWSNLSISARTLSISSAVSASMRSEHQPLHFGPVKCDSSRSHFVRISPANGTRYPSIWDGRQPCPPVWFRYTIPVEAGTMSARPPISYRRTVVCSLITFSPSDRHHSATK